jgi:hypothetical protein
MLVLSVFLVSLRIGVGLFFPIDELQPTVVFHVATIQSMRNTLVLFSEKEGHSFCLKLDTMM